MNRHESRSNQKKLIQELHRNIKWIRAWTNWNGKKRCCTCCCFIWNVCWLGRCIENPISLLICTHLNWTNCMLLNVLRSSLTIPECLLIGSGSPNGPGWTIVPILCYRRLTGQRYTWWSKALHARQAPLVLRHSFLWCPDWQQKLQTCTVAVGRDAGAAGRGKWKQHCRCFDFPLQMASLTLICLMLHGTTRETCVASPVIPPKMSLSMAEAAYWHCFSSRTLDRYYPAWKRCCSLLTAVPLRPYDWTDAFLAWTVGCLCSETGSLPWYVYLMLYLSQPLRSSELIMSRNISICPCWAIVISCNTPIILAASLLLPSGAKPEIEGPVPIFLRSKATTLQDNAKRRPDVKRKFKSNK